MDGQNVPWMDELVDTPPTGLCVSFFRGPPPKMASISSLVSL